MKLKDVKIIKKFVVDADSRLILGQHKTKKNYIVAVFSFEYVHGLKVQYPEPDMLYAGEDIDWADDVYNDHKKTLSDYMAG